MELAKELSKRIVDSVREDDYVELMKELLPAGQPDAENPLDPSLPSAREEGVALFVAERLRSMGFDVQLPAGCDGRPNVVGLLKGSSGKPSLILNDHLDTWPAGDSKKWNMTNFDPYNPTIHGRRIYGRGTSDTRGNLASQLVAVQALLKIGLKFKGDLLCVYTVDEERLGIAGARFLLEEKGLRADYSITAEPTSWTKGDERGIGIAIAHAGNCILEIETKGIGSHIQKPDAGVNAIFKMATLLSKLERLEFTHVQPKVPGSTKPVVSIPMVVGGEIAADRQFVPDRCKARLLVVGVVPGMTKESILSDIENVIQRLKKEDKDFEAEVRLAREWNNFVPATLEVEEDVLHLKALVQSYQEITGQKPVLYRKNAYCDTSRFSLHGIPALTFGPGEDNWSPINEFIDLDQAMIATKTYALAIPRILGVAE